MPRHSKKNSPQERGRLIARAARLFELPADIAAGSAHIELSGNREAVVDGCRGVLEYNENIIRLRTGGLSVCFCGRGLSIRSLTRDSAVVEGFITSMEFRE